MQNYYGVTCDPSLPYDADFVPPATKAPRSARDYVKVSRQNFIELCLTLSAEDEAVFEDLFRSVGLSVDWNYTYRTIDDTARADLAARVPRGPLHRQRLLAGCPHDVGRDVRHRGRTG